MLSNLDLNPAANFDFYLREVVGECDTDELLKIPEFYNLFARYFRDEVIKEMIEYEYTDDPD